MAEDYVRPPLVAVEPPSRRRQVWRFRVVAALAVLALVVLTVLVVRALVTNGEDDPGVDGLVSSPVTSAQPVAG